MHRLTEDFSSSSNSPAASRHHFRLLRLCSACSGCCSLTTLHLGVLRLTCSGTPQTIPYNPGPVLLPVNLEGHRGPGKSSLDASSFVRPGDGRGRAVAAAATPRPIGGRGRAAAAATPRLRAPGRRTGKSVDGRGFGVRDSGRICISNLESVGSTYSSKGGGIDSDGESQPRADRRRRQEIVDPWPTSGKRTCCSRMDEYIASLHEASVGILGEGLRDAEGMGSRAMPPPPTVASQQSEAAMSASGGVGNSDVAGPSRGHGKATAPRNKQSNFSVYEDNILCKSWLEISCDPITNTGQRKGSFWGRITTRYNSQRGNYPERSLKSISTRWDLIKAEVGKFAGYMAEMIRSNPSGVSDSDKSVKAAANFADVEKHNFGLMHCWHILKDEPKWMELKRSMDKVKKSSLEVTPQNSNSNTVDLDQNESSLGTSSGKRPMGRDTAKAAKKKATTSYEFASKMHELSVQKMSLFKESEDERKARFDEIVTLEKVKVEEAREHRRTMEELERERLAMDKQRLQMEAENNEKKEDEHMAINLDQCLPYQSMYYQALQEEIINKLNARRQGPSQ